MTVEASGSRPPHMLQPELAVVEDADLAGQTSHSLGPDSTIGGLIDTDHFVFAGTSAGLRQVMHPEIGAAVEYMSNFREDPWDRILRSLYPISSSVTHPHPLARIRISRAIRDVHRGIHGKDEKDRRFNALSQDPFSWAHLTFVDALERAATDYTSTPASPELSERIYAEGMVWWKGYGFPMTSIPSEHSSFRQRFADAEINQLEMTPAAEHVIDLTANKKIPRLPFISPKQWRRNGWLLQKGLKLMAFGGLSEALREKHGIPFTSFDQVAFTGIKKAFQAGLQVPEAYRFNPPDTLKRLGVVLEDIEG